MAGQHRSLWGWHRLDNGWARRIVAEAGVADGDLVVDVGAGSGALTRALVVAGARVIAVELHRARADRLRNDFADLPVIVVQADASDLRLPRRPFRVVANPPFAVLAPLLRRLTAPGSRLTSADIVVSRHVAQQWTGANAPGRVRWSRTFSVTTGRAVPRDAFHPPPPRGAVVLQIRRRPAYGGPYSDGVSGGRPVGRPGRPVGPHGHRGAAPRRGPRRP